jgi:hypothetical protein
VKSAMKGSVGDAWSSTHGAMGRREAKTSEDSSAAASGRGQGGFYRAKGSEMRCWGGAHRPTSSVS